MRAMCRDRLILRQVMTRALRTLIPIALKERVSACPKSN
ncbi:hypothetical protein RK21_01642 [Pseudomonas plecoglossicida]|nr:hypothetical protein RK21_01642 [Pseudomonas plecoglossicida]